MTNLEFTLTVLKEIKTPYLIHGDSLIIYPKSNAYMQILPGYFNHNEETKRDELHCIISEDMLITPKLVASIIGSFQGYL